ncbi:MAG: extracellular solute-binding protein [Endomicrobiales bacterium]|nr:extracellular solute-binding protein [Endomicrobiales bacterium]
MTTIKFWLMPNAGFESKDVIDTEIRHFSRVNPKIKVEYEILSWSRVWFKLIEAIKEKSGPDVIQIGTTWVGTLAYLGAIEKVDKKRINNAKFSDTILNMCRYFDSYWALPWFCDGRVLYYRKDFLKKSNIEPESVNSWENFRLACIRLSKAHNEGKQIPPIGFSCQKELAVLQDLASFVWSNGGNFVSDDAKHATFTSEETHQGLKYFSDLILNHLISEPSLEQNAGEVAENFFLHDTYAFMFSSTWPLQAYLNDKFKHYIGKQRAQNFGVMNVPAGKAGRFNFAGGSALAVTSFSKNPDKAWKFIEFLTQKDSLSRFCSSVNMIPGRTETHVSLNVDKPEQKVFEDSINRYGKSFPVHPLWGSIEQIAVKGIAQTLMDFRQSNFNQTAFFANITEINQEIEYMLSVFGE